MRFTAMASVLFVSDCFAFMSVRLQLHLSPRVREEGPAGLQPERQGARTNSISQKAVQLHRTSTEGERLEPQNKTVPLGYC